MTQSYNYKARSGLHPVSWTEFHALCKGLVMAAAPFDPQLILAVGRGGYYPGTLMAHMLRTEIYPIRLSRRVDDVVQHERPQWIVRPPDAVAGLRVLVVDEISSTGETLAMVRAAIEQMGAASVRSAVLYAHTTGVDEPNYIGLISDALVLNPWDREVFADGAFGWHPEYSQALQDQGVVPEPALLIGADLITPAKG